MSSNFIKFLLFGLFLVVFSACGDTAVEIHRSSDTEILETLEFFDDIVDDIDAVEEPYLNYCDFLKQNELETPALVPDAVRVDIRWTQIGLTELIDSENEHFGTQDFSWDDVETGVMEAGSGQVQSILFGFTCRSFTKYNEPPFTSGIWNTAESFVYDRQTEVFHGLVVPNSVLEDADVCYSYVATTCHNKGGSSCWGAVRFDTEALVMEVTGDLDYCVRSPNGEYSVRTAGFKVATVDDKSPNPLSRHPQILSGVFKMGIHTPE